MKRVSIIIPSYGEAKTLKEVLHSVLQSTYEEKEVIVVDNGISNETLNQLAELRDVKIIKPGKNLGAAGGRNLGAKYSAGDYILFLDHDVVLEKDTIAKMINILETNTDIGVVGPQILFRSYTDKVWWSGGTVKIPSGRVVMSNRKLSGIVDTDVVPAAIMVRRELFERIGGFYEKYFATFEDSDFCFRVKRAGYRVVCMCDALAYHDIEPIDMKRIFSRMYFIFRNRILFMKRNSDKSSFLVYLLFYNQIYALYYLLLALKYGKLRAIQEIIKGTIDGLREI